MKHTVYSKVLNGQLEYAFNKDSILAASDEAVPQSFHRFRRVEQLRKGVELEEKRSYR
jgi:hypothetical protein